MNPRAPEDIGLAIQRNGQTMRPRLTTSKIKSAFKCFWSIFLFLIISNRRRFLKKNISIPRMYSFYDLVDKMKRYGGFQRKEWYWVIGLIILLTIFTGFDDGAGDFNFAFWLSNFIAGLIASVVAILGHQFAQRAIALEEGYRLEFTPSFYGIVAGVILLLLSGGALVFFGYSGFRLHAMHLHRIGYFRHNLGFFTIAKVAAAGPLFNMGIALLAFALPIADILKIQLVVVNVVVALSNLLPIPLYDGFQLFIGSRSAFAFIFGWALTTGILLLLSIFGLLQISLWWILFISVIGSIVIATIYLFKIEKNLKGFS